MAIKKTNIVFELIRENEYNVTAEGFTEVKLYATTGVSVAERCNLTGKDRWYIRISPLYDTKSVLNDLTALANAKAKAAENVCEEKPERNKEFEKMILQEYLKEEPPFNAALDICVYQQRPYTHAIAVYKTLWSGHGYSKCNPIDEWDEDLGALIAVKRAARDLYQRMPNNYSQKKGN